MVRMYGAQMSDVTDRVARRVGRVTLYDPGLSSNVGVDVSATDAISTSIYMLYAMGFGCALNGATWDRLRSNYKNLLVRERPWQNRIPSGRVVCEDDFEGTLAWSQINGTVTKASDAGYVNSKSYALKCVTGAVAGNVATGRRILPQLPEASTYATLGFFGALSAAAATTPRFIRVFWLVEDKTLNALYKFGLALEWYVGANPERYICYWGSGVDWVNVDAFRPLTRITVPQFHYFEITIKRTAGSFWKYEKIRFDDRAWSLTGTATEVQAFSIEGQTVDLECVTDAAAATTAYFDDFTIVSSLDEVP